MFTLNKTLDKYSIDRVTLLISLSIVFLTALFILSDEEFAKLTIENTYALVTSVFGSSYLVLTLCCFVFLIFLSCSKYGSYKLGGQSSLPEFSYFSWIGMLFCSGIGGGIIYWSGVEWAYYIEIPQFGISPYSDEAYSLATAYGLFHWGISAWSIYGIPAIALSIAFYKYNLHSLRLSSSLTGLGFKNIESSVFGRFIDLIFILSTVGAAGGLVPNFSPLTDAITRERAAGVPASAIRVGSSPALKSSGNPGGLGVYNTIHEPSGLGQGISRSRKMGINPKTAYEVEKRPFYATKDGIGKAVTDIFAQII